MYGSLPPEIADGTPIAVAVNGTIGAVTRAGFEDKQGRRFAALVADESLFVPGRNTLELYEVTADGPVPDRGPVTYPSGRGGRTAGHRPITVYPKV